MSAVRPLADAPSLTLVRPRRTGDSGDGTTAGAPTGTGPNHTGPHTVAADTAGTVVADSGAATAPEDVTTQPLDPQDRQLLATMSPALATALVEVLVGSRAPGSIEKWVEVPLFERILEHSRIREELSQRNPHTDRPLTTSEPRLCEVSDCVVEIAVVVTTTRRRRALALRLTRRRSRWRLSDFLSI